VKTEITTAEPTLSALIFWYERMGPQIRIPPVDVKSVDEKKLPSGSEYWEDLFFNPYYSVTLRERTFQLESLFGCWVEVGNEDELLDELYRSRLHAD
jgi:hypothetical protein